MDVAFAEFDVTLRDGRAVHVRAVGAADEEEIVQAYGRLSAETRYLRFMNSASKPDIGRFRKALTSFPDHGLGIVATVPADDGVDIVGSALYFDAGDRKTCEFAITVAAGFGGAGLATVLMRSLIDSAKRRGIGEMDGFVLSDNGPMLRLARRLGFTIAPDPDDRTVRICRLRLDSKA
jgi:RimJ/RimL family protein N-acetyltransferase